MAGRPSLITNSQGIMSAIPPNGFAGAAQQTPAVRHHLSVAHMHNTSGKAHNSSKTHGFGNAPGRGRRRKAKTAHHATTRKRKGKARGSSKGLKILKAGSAAAKAWGAKMKRHRKKKGAAAAGT